MKRNDTTPRLKKGKSFVISKLGRRPPSISNPLKKARDALLKKKKGNNLERNRDTQDRKRRASKTYNRLQARRGNTGRYNLFIFAVHPKKSCPQRKRETSPEETLWHAYSGVLAR